MKAFVFYAFISIASLFRTVSICGQTFKEQFIDTVDNKLDISPWLSQAHGFVPMPGVITEPAVGFGGSLGALFVHRKPGDLSPPGITYTGGFYTENASWGLIGAHVNNWKQDRIRYTGVIGYVDVNLTYYHVMTNGTTVPFQFSLSGTPFIQKLMFRLSESNFFLGSKYSFFTNEVVFKVPGDIPNVEDRFKKAKIGGLSLVFGHDDRDNMFTPNTGVKSEISLTHYDSYLGSDFKFSLVESYGIIYHQSHPRLVSGIKANYSMVWGDSPFYAEPFIDMRGIPVMRYQDNQIIQLEIEERWHMQNRWSIVAFGGIGKAYETASSWSMSETAWSAGGGIRYLLAKLFKMHGGLDIAKGPEQWAFYFVIGSSWSRQ